MKTHEVMGMYFDYGEAEISYLRQKDKRLCEVIDRTGHIDRVVDMYVEAGVDRLGTWTYRGGYGTIVAAPEPLKLWDRIGENYRRVLKK